MRYLVNEAGDIYGQRRDDGTVKAVDPDQWGWRSREDAAPADLRRTIHQVRALPGFTVTVVELGPKGKFIPGPRHRGVKWMEWAEGAAPPAAIESGGGVEGSASPGPASGHTLAYFNRLSDALGRVAERLPARPERSPFVVHDFVQGRYIEIVYLAPFIGPGGEGVVYVVDDGDAFKIGHTLGPPAGRIASLQTGNPRVIQTVATIAAASPDVENHLHEALAQWTRMGEWFEREPILKKVAEAGGWSAYLKSVLPPGEWSITTYGGA